MWEFLDRLISVAAPRIRDFRGLPDKGFDGRGNYTVGFKEQIIFPEIDLDSVEKIRGMDVTFVTTARTDQEAYELLKELGLAHAQARNADAGGGRRLTTIKPVTNLMAKTCLIAKSKKTPKFPVRAHNRCRRCGRPRAYLAQVRPVPHLLS